MATITNHEVEALARELLREQIDRSGWFAGMTEEARTAAIAADVEQWWHLKAKEAAGLLLDSLIEPAPRKIA